MFSESQSIFLCSNAASKAAVWRTKNKEITLCTWTVLSASEELFIGSFPFGLREFPNLISFFMDHCHSLVRKKSGHGLRQYCLSAAKPHLAES